MSLLMFFPYPTSIFIIHDRYNFRFCQVYLQYEIAILKIVTRHGLQSVQESRMVKLGIKLANIMSTIMSTERILII